MGREKKVLELGFQGMMKWEAVGIRCNVMWGKAVRSRMGREGRRGGQRRGQLESEFQGMMKREAEGIKRNAMWLEATERQNGTRREKRRIWNRRVGRERKGAGIKVSGHDEVAG